MARMVTMAAAEWSVKLGKYIPGFTLIINLDAIELIEVHEAANCCTIRMFSGKELDILDLSPEEMQQLIAAPLPPRPHTINGKRVGW